MALWYEMQNFRGQSECYFIYIFLGDRIIQYVTQTSVAPQKGKPSH